MFHVDQFCVDLVGDEQSIEQSLSTFSAIWKDISWNNNEKQSEKLLGFTRWNWFWQIRW